MNRLYMIESAFSLTGGMADHRMRAKPSQMAAVAAQVASELGIQVTGYESGKLSDEEKSELLGSAENFDSWIRECVADLKAHEGKAVVLAGSRHGEDLQRIVIAINKVVTARSALQRKVASLALKLRISRAEPPFCHEPRPWRPMSPAW